MVYNGHSTTKPNTSTGSKERLPRAKLWGHAYLYTSIYTMSTEASPAFSFFHKISPPGPEEASNSLLLKKTLKKGFGCLTILIWGVGTWVEDTTLNSSHFCLWCADPESAWESQDHREASRHAVCGHQVSQPLDFPLDFTTYAQEQLGFDKCIFLPCLPTHHAETRSSV